MFAVFAVMARCINEQPFTLLLVKDHKVMAKN